MDRSNAAMAVYEQQEMWNLGLATDLARCHGEGMLTNEKENCKLLAKEQNNWHELGIYSTSQI